MAELETISREVYLEVAAGVAAAAKDLWSAAESARKLQDHVNIAVNTAAVSGCPMDRAEAAVSKSEARAAAEWAATRAKIVADMVKQLAVLAEEALQTAEDAKNALHNM